LLDAVQQLYLEAGEPSLRSVQRQAGPGVIGYNTVNNVLKAPADHKLTHLRTVVRVLGGDEEALARLWVEAKREKKEPSGDFTPAGPVTDEDLSPGAHAPGDVDEDTAPAEPAMDIDAAQPDDAAGHPVTAGDCRATGMPDDVPPSYPAGTHRPLGDELFLVSHDRFDGKPLLGRNLAFGFAGAALGELLLARRIDVIGDRLTVPHEVDLSATGGDLLTEYFFRELADEDQRATVTVADWVRGTAEEACRRIALRLAQDDIIVIRRRPRKFLYPRTQKGQEVSPELRAGRHLLDDVPPADLQTRLLVALVHVIDMPAGLAVPRLSERQLKQRMEPSRHLLPPAAQAIVGAVERVIWNRAVMPRWLSP
jgi:hypothetical protein